MFVCNVSLNKTKLVKIFFGIVAIILIIFFLFSAYRIFKESMNSRTNDTMPNPDVISVSAENYTNVLKTVHDNLDAYVGKKICFSGYVYRVSDFNEKQFVLARDMIISSDLRTLVVGFLCESKQSQSYENGTWVQITGRITKGNYHEEIPVIEVLEIKKIDKPEDSYVYPPDDSFVPTVNLF